MLHGLRKRFGSKMIRLFRKIGIFRRLLLIMLILVILPTGFIILFSFRQYVSEIEKNTEHFLSLLVQNIVFQIEEKMSDYEKQALDFYSDRQILTALAENESISRNDSDFSADQVFLQNRQMIGQRMSRLAGNNRYIRNIQFITEYDQYYMVDEYGYRRGACLHDLPVFLTSPYYQGTVKNQGYPVWYDTTKTNNLFYKYDGSVYGISDCITMAVAVYTPASRTLLGILVYNIDSHFLTDSLNNYSFYGSGNTFLLGESGVITGIDPSINAPNFGSQIQMQQKMRDMKNGSFSQRIDGMNTFISFRQSQRGGIYVAHIVDKNTFLATAYRICYFSLVLVVILTVICIFLAYCVAISISRPLNQLVIIMKAFVEKRFDARYPEDGHDEVSELGRSFNEMADNTHALVEKIIISELRQKTLELSRANAELNALQMQISPHFLYNTMDIIRWEAIYESDGESKVSQMIDDFCHLMRLSIKFGEDMVPVSKELEHVSAYIDVVNFRHTGKIRLFVKCDPPIENYFIPKLTLQPLVENAVLHAFNQESDDFSICIDCCQTGQDAEITVADNGCGMSPREVDSLQESFVNSNVLQQSVGLRNVNQRFLLYFGSSYGIKLKSVLGQGTEVTVRFPVGSLQCAVTPLDEKEASR